MTRLLLLLALLAGSARAQTAAPAAPAAPPELPIINEPTDACPIGLQYQLINTTFPDRRYTAAWDMHAMLITLATYQQWQCVGFAQYISFGRQYTDIVAVWINKDGSVGASTVTE